MLTQIHIANLATIEEAHLDLSAGTTVITGETGSGKSMIIDAILLALGGRASPQMIRAGQDKMDLRLCFDLRHFKDLPESLKNLDLDLQGQECIVRRTLQRDGRSRSFLNDLPVTLPVLREFSEAVLDIHGQHEHQSLLKLEQQRELLDRFGKQVDLVKQVQQQAEAYRALEQDIKSKQSAGDLREQRRDFLRYQLNEIETLQLQPQEWRRLEAEHQRLAHADSLLQNLTQALADLSRHEENNILALLHRAQKSLEVLRQVSPQIEAWVTALRTAAIHVDDTSNEIHHYLDTLDLNPERLHWVEQRMQSLHDLARKYKVTPQALPDLQQQLQAELAALENNDQILAELLSKQRFVLQEYTRLAQQLSEKRRQAADALGREITQIIQTLDLPRAEFKIELQKENELAVSSHGLEKISFQVKTNRGSPLLPLAKIASGGELSRISLAIHLATAGQHTLSTLVFDEVDVGIGGGTAERVGRLIRRLGQTHQVLCITHLPQVAAYGHHHIAVNKVEKKDQAVTRLRRLDMAEKIKEIARMLGGIQITATTLKHAEEMLGAIV